MAECKNWYDKMKIITLPGPAQVGMVNSQILCIQSSWGFRIPLSIGVSN